MSESAARSGGESALLGVEVEESYPSGYDPFEEAKADRAREERNEQRREARAKRSASQVGAVTGLRKAGGVLGGKARPVPFVAVRDVQRNAPCPCGSGFKHKRCCGDVTALERLDGGASKEHAPNRGAASVDEYRASLAPELAVPVPEEEKGQQLRRAAERLNKILLRVRPRADARAPCPCLNPVPRPDQGAQSSCPRASVVAVGVPGLSLYSTGEPAHVVVPCRSPGCSVCARDDHQDESAPPCRNAKRLSSGRWEPCFEPGCESCSEKYLSEHESRDDYKRLDECPDPVKLRRWDYRKEEWYTWEKPCDTKGCEYCGPRRKKRTVAHFIDVFKRLPARRFVTLTLDQSSTDLEPCESGDYLKHIWRTKYIKRLKRRLDKVPGLSRDDLKYVASIEPHKGPDGGTLEDYADPKNGAYAHLHAVFSCPLPAHVIKNQWFASGGGVKADVQVIGGAEEIQTEEEEQHLARKIGYALKYAFKQDADGTNAFAGEQMNSKSIGYYSKESKEKRRAYAEKHPEDYPHVASSAEKSGGQPDGSTAPVSGGASSPVPAALRAPVSEEMAVPEEAADWCLAERASYEMHAERMGEEISFPWSDRYGDWKGPGGAGKKAKDAWDCPQPSAEAPALPPDYDDAGEWKEPPWVPETLRARWDRISKEARLSWFIENAGDATGVRVRADRIEEERTREDVIRIVYPSGKKSWRVPDYAGELKEVRDSEEYDENNPVPVGKSDGQ